MMKKVKVHLQSCFGIRELSHDFDFSKSNAVVIYAPNGTMKTSFARTMACVADGRQKEIKDRLKRNGKVGTVEIAFDGVPVATKKERRIFVVNGEDFIDAGNSVANILADSSQHRDYSDARRRLQVAFHYCRFHENSRAFGLGGTEGDSVLLRPYATYVCHGAGVA